eukprot:1456748-Pleurochrysis_carterae.AAC.1
MTALIEAADLPRLSALAEAMADEWRTALRARVVLGSETAEGALLPNSTMPARPTQLLRLLQTQRWLISTDGVLHAPNELWVSTKQ